MLKKLELSKEQFSDLFLYCKKKRINFLSTPYDFDDVDFLEKLGVNAYKLSSMHLIEPNFIDYVLKKNKTTIISTGMSNIVEIQKMYKSINKKINKKKLILMQCTTNYPSSIFDCNLNVLDKFKNDFNCLVGYSDHTMETLPTLLSIAKGACVIEKHFTLNTKDYGPDHSSSFDPIQMKNLINNIRKVENILGSDNKKPSKDEIINKISMRRSVYSRIFIKQGSKIADKHLIYKRPSNGISPSNVKNLINKKTTIDIKANTLIKWSMFS